MTWMWLEWLLVGFPFVATAEATECSTWLLVPHEGAVLPPGFAVVGNDGSSRCDGVAVRDAVGSPVLLDARAGGCFAPADLEDGQYTFTAGGELDASITGTFTVDASASWEPPDLSVGPLEVDRARDLEPGCEVSPTSVDFRASVAFDAEDAALSGWWLVMDVSDSNGDPLRTARVPVSPPAVPGTGRGIAVDFPRGTDAVCAQLRWAGPDGRAEEAVDLGCESLVCGCATTRPSALGGALGLGLVGLLVVGRRRAPR